MVSIRKIKRIDKNGKETTKTISYRLQFIDSTRFIASSLSNLVDNLVEGIHKTKSKHGHDNKKNVKRVEFNTKIVNAILNTQTLKMI